MSRNSSPNVRNKPKLLANGDTKIEEKDIKPSEFTLSPQSESPYSSKTKAFFTIESLRKLEISQNERIEIILKTGVKVPAIASVSRTLKNDNSVEISAELRRLLGAVYGDKVSISKFKQTVATCETVLVNFIGSETISQWKISNVLKKVDFIIPGVRLKIDEVECEFWQKDTDISQELSQMSLSSNKLRNMPFYFENSSKIDLNLVSSLSPSDYDYSRIGGVSKALAILKAKLELPLHRPELFQRFSMNPDRGFLLHGPPGTGKTMLLRAIAHETDAYVFNIKSSEIVSQYYGQTEKAVAKVFEDAKNHQPSIIFIDEIDALVPKRDDDDSSESANRLVAAFLTLMDGIQGDSEVVVIGSTNRPNSIDPALRRAGRFGQEIEISIPDADGRLEILNLQFEKIPHKLPDSFIDSIAAVTHGYVGADLYELCRDAVNRAIQRGVGAKVAADEMFVLQDDVEQAMIDIRPSAMKEISLETPRVLWSDIGGLEDVKQRLKESVEWPLHHPEAFQRLGVTPPRGILLYGPPGCSKTLIAKAVATEGGLNFLAVKGPELFNKYLGESERAVREIFRKARAASPSIIFFDEIDALSAKRGESSHIDGVLTSLLNEMDGIEALNDVIVLAATNVPEMIDDALMRPGRLDRLIYVAPPDKNARFKILEIQAKKMAISNDVNLQEIAESTEGCSGAEVVSLCQEAGIIALNENMNETAIQTRHFVRALEKSRKSITTKMIAHYEEFDKK